MPASTTIETIKTQTLARIEELTAAPKPTYSVDGQSVSWTEYLRQLQGTVDWCNSQLAAEDPFEVDSQATT